MLMSLVRCSRACLRAQFAPRLFRLGVASLVFCLVLMTGSFLDLAAQSSQPSPAPPVQKNAQPANPATASPTRYHAGVPRRAVQYYSMMWGVDSLDVKWTESGEVVRFTYRVLDPAKAAVLNDTKFEPSLIDPQAGVKLVVPALEKVGKLRQSSTPEAGKTYWMAFSNKGRYVKKGHRVDVVIGTFRAEGLVVN
jgi:hypothetical protein